MAKSNGEFKGTVKAQIDYLQRDIQEIKADVKVVRSTLDNYHEDITTLKTRATIYAGLASFGISTAVAIAAVVFF